MMSWAASIPTLDQLSLPHLHRHLNLSDERKWLINGLDRVEPCGLVWFGLNALVTSSKIHGELQQAQAAGKTWSVRQKSIICQMKYFNIVTSSSTCPLYFAKSSLVSSDSRSRATLNVTWLKCGEALLVKHTPYSSHHKIEARHKDLSWSIFSFDIMSPHGDVSVKGRFQKCNASNALVKCDRC